MLDAPAPRSVPLAWGFAALTVATFALVVLGALVRAHGAGLACPDWPLCFGSVVPAFDLRVAFEWSHRVLAGSISLGLLALTAVALRTPGIRRRCARPIAAAWVLLLVQIALGALTVLLLLSPWTVTAHLIVGTGLCATLLWTACDLFDAGPGERTQTPVSPALRVCVAGIAILLFAQILLGGLVSSHAAGLACAAFPTCDGAELAPTLSGQVGLHVIHRLNAYVLVLAFGALAILSRGHPAVGRLALAALSLVILQVGLGAMNVLLRLPVEVTSLHSATACALALAVTLIVREAVRSRVPVAPGTPAHPRALEVG